MKSRVVVSAEPIIRYIKEYLKDSIAYNNISMDVIEGVLMLYLKDYLNFVLFGNMFIAENSKTRFLDIGLDDETCSLLYDITNNLFGQFILNIMSSVTNDNFGTATDYTIYEFDRIVINFKYN